LYKEVKKFESLKIIEVVRQRSGNSRACAQRENHIKGSRDLAALILKLALDEDEKPSLA
jgi:hypothetical protein